MNDPKLGNSSRSGLVYRYRKGDACSGPSIILLHGLGGDENSMWVLEQGLPEGGLNIAPRGLFPINGEGYSWVKPFFQGWPTAKDFEPAATALKNLIDELEDEIGLNRDKLFLMGFSQGAALAFVAAADPLFRLRAIIAAAGFLPNGEYRHISGVPIFWGHGSRDEWIPIERARSDAALLRDVGGNIRFCEADIGHKLGLECLNGLKGWIEGILESG